ncbi:HNH endonuclease [Bdellovibrio sp. HCB-162]|uniref:HNH endonuclease n=1 Tax=Bdellovibrio sp. HCB-162 TaxID=3394234 RepID=UPI0039BD01B4
MDLSKIANSELLGRLEKLTRTERKMTHLILCHINEVESRRLYAELGFDSMFKYLTKYLGYGEDSAYRRLQAARLLKQVPAVAEKIENGMLNLTQLTQVQKCLKQENHLGHKINNQQTVQVLEEIQNKSSFETKRFLAQEFNHPIQTHEVIKPQQDNSVRIEVMLTEDQMKTLQQAKDLLSHVLPDGNWADLFTLLAKKHIHKETGKTVKPNNTKSQSLKCEGKLTPSFTTERKRKHVKVTLKRELLKNANHCCEYIAPTTGIKCTSTYQLQVDHRIPLACGGSHSPDNLRVLCRTHNLLSAQQWGLS